MNTTTTTILIIIGVAMIITNIGDQQQQRHLDGKHLPTVFNKTATRMVTNNLRGHHHTRTIVKPSNDWSMLGVSSIRTNLVRRGLINLHVIALMMAGRVTVGTLIHIMFCFVLSKAVTTSHNDTKLVHQYIAAVVAVILVLVPIDLPVGKLQYVMMVVYVLITASTHILEAVAAMMELWATVQQNDTDRVVVVVVQLIGVTITVLAMVQFTCVLHVVCLLYNLIE
jgi:ABC-type multidrug transport system fused ATPase/permease subunit